MDLFIRHKKKLMFWVKMNHWDTDPATNPQRKKWKKQNSEKIQFVFFIYRLIQIKSYMCIVFASYCAHGGSRSAYCQLRTRPVSMQKQVSKAVLLDS